MTFAQKLLNLMDENKVTSYRMGLDTGISNRLIDYWKKGDKMPSFDNIQKVSKYFEVSTDFLLGTAPFDMWDYVVADKYNFLKATGVSPSVLDLVYGLPLNPDLESYWTTKTLVNFISNVVKSISYDKNDKNNKLKVVLNLKNYQTVLKKRDANLKRISTERNEKIKAFTNKYNTSPDLREIIRILSQANENDIKTILKLIQTEKFDQKYPAPISSDFSNLF